MKKLFWLVPVVALILAACGGSAPQGLALLLTPMEDGSNIIVPKTTDPSVTFAVGSLTFQVVYFSYYPEGTIVFMSTDGKQVSYGYPQQWRMAVDMNRGIPPVTVEEYPYLVVIGAETLALWNSKEAPLEPFVIPPTPIAFPATQTPTPMPTFTPTPCPQDGVTICPPTP